VTPSPQFSTPTPSSHHQNSFFTSSPHSLPHPPSPTPPRQDISQRVAHYNEILTNRENQTKLRMEELRYQLYEEEMRECTFRPQITQVAAKLSYYPPPSSGNSHPAEDDFYSMDGQSIDSNSTAPAFERLYQQKNKIPKSIAEKKHRTQEERELDGCTFTPQIFHSKSYSDKTTATATQQKPVKTTTNIPFSADGPDREGEYELERQSSDDTYERLNEMSTKNSIIEIMRERQYSAEKKIEEPSSSKTPPPPPPPEPKGYAESVQRYDLHFPFLDRINVVLE
jgi:hypothetical protein